MATPTTAPAGFWAMVLLSGRGEAILTLHADAPHLGALLEPSTESATPPARSHRR